MIDIEISKYWNEVPILCRNVNEYDKHILVALKRVRNRESCSNF